MKLSELTYDYLLGIGLGSASMHTDRSDALRSLYDEYQFEQAKQELMARYGDVNLIIDAGAVWYDQIKIDDAKWREDHEKFCEEKRRWCDRYGSE